MAAKIVNIEICERIIKVCEITKKGSGYQIHNSFMLKTPAGSVADGQLNNVDLIAETLGGALKEKGLTRCNAVFSVISGRIAVREVTVPPVKDARIAALVQSNAAEYFPIDLTKYHTAYSLLERRDKGEKPCCRLLVYAAPLSLLEKYFELASKCGLTVQAIDYCGNGQYQAVKDIDDDRVTMYVNVGTTTTYVTFMHAGNLMLQRTFPAGGDELVTYYMNASGMAENQYIQAVEELSRGDDSPVYQKMTRKEINESLSRLVNNLARTSDYFNQNNWEHPVENVILMGVCSKLAGLREGISEIREDMDISYLDELPTMNKLANASESASFYISCIGSVIKPLDLIPESMKADKKKDKSKNKKASILGGAVICAVCLLAGIGLSVTAIVNYWTSEANKTLVQEQISSLEYTEDVYNTYLSYSAAAGQLEAVGGLTVSYNQGLRAFFDELEDKMPSDIIVLSAVCSRDSIVLNVTVSSKESAAETIVQLRSFESISNIQVSAINETTDEAGLTYVAFSTTCTYGENPYLPTENAE